LYRWSTTKDKVHTKEILFGTEGDVSKKTHLFKVDVSITNESLKIYEALEAF
jgi:hypothetical protein